MRWVLAGVVVLVGLSIGGCGGKSAPMPGTRVIAPGVYSACDRGNRIYFGDGGQMQIIAMGCLDGQP